MPSPTREGLQALLERRTELFGALKPGRESFARAARSLLDEERSSRPALMAHAVALCPLAGFVDRGKGRVGCLGHPASTGGPDLRDCGSFGALTCEAFRCDATDAPTEEEAALVRDACGDWFLYGLAITDVDLVRACLSAVSVAAGRPLRAGDLRSAGSLRALRCLFALKEISPKVFAARPTTSVALVEERVLGAVGLPVDDEGRARVRDLAGVVAAALAAPEARVAG